MSWPFRISASRADAPREDERRAPPYRATPASRPTSQRQRGQENQRGSRVDFEKLAPSRAKKPFDASQEKIRPKANRDAKPSITPGDTSRHKPVQPKGAASPTLLAFACGIVLVASLVLGGGTRSGFLSDALLQLLATPLLLISVWRLPGSGATARAPTELLFCTALALIPLLQLVPLPPWLWTALPGREVILESFTLANQELPWWPNSLAPHATWLGLVSLVVPLSIFLATIQLIRRERRILSLVVLAVGAVSVVLGLLQVAQGPNSPLRFFPFTNPTEAVGFFANRNHFAALLYSLMLIAAAWTVHAATQFSATGPRKAYDTPLVLALLAGLAVIVMLIAAQIMTRSRAGLALAMVGLFGVWALAVRDQRGTTGLSPGRLLAGAIGLAMVFGTQFALYRVLGRFDADPLSDARIPFALNTLEAAIAHLPFGSGVGTFVPVYQMFEKLHELRHLYANRAHNDFLEILLESGLPALFLIGAFLVWLVRRSVWLWQVKPRPGEEIDLLLARAASMALAFIVMHSLVDYPLRTGAIMALFAFAAALMIEPPDAPEPPKRTAQSNDRVRPRKTERPVAPQFSSAPPRRPLNQDWPDIEWPEAWRRPPGRSDIG